MFVEHVFQLTTQDDADAIIAVPVDTRKGPVTLESVVFNITAVAGSPTGVTLDLNLTDGSASKVPIAAAALGTAADVVKMEPSAAAKAAGDHIIPIEESTAWWTYTLDLNFAGGTTPTVSGFITVRWRH